MRKKFLPGFLKQTILIIPVVMVLGPLFYIVMGAFKTKVDYITNQAGLPKQFVLDNFRTLLTDGQMLMWFRNSIFVMAFSVVISVVISALAAYSFAKIRFKARDKIFNFIISLMVIPPIVMIIPIFVLATKTRLVNTYWSAILIYVGLMMPFNIYLLRNFFITIPQSLIDSAKIDGCNDMVVFLRIIIPLAKTALITLTVVSVLWVWNELLVALIFLQKKSLTTLMVGLVQYQGKYKINQPAMLAGVLVSLVPMLLIYLFGQRYFVRGLTAGALKGE
ncbi:MAG: carbohydrate ABC transporter permease [Spirochaetales bacterium]|nr:MAG: carbohydrate ABC transporter permease [Spirochaetales bacterium]